MNIWYFLKYEEMCSLLGWFQNNTFKQREQPHSDWPNSICQCFSSSFTDQTGSVSYGGLVQGDTWTIRRRCCWWPGSNYAGPAQFLSSLTASLIRPHFLLLYILLYLFCKLGHMPFSLLSGHFSTLHSQDHSCTTSANPLRYNTALASSYSPCSTPVNSLLFYQPWPWPTGKGFGLETKGCRFDPWSCRKNVGHGSGWCPHPWLKCPWARHLTPDCSQSATVVAQRSGLVCASVHCVLH